MQEILHIAPLDYHQCDSGNIVKAPTANPRPPNTNIEDHLCWYCAISVQTLAR